MQASGYPHYYGLKYIYLPSSWYVRVLCASGAAEGCFDRRKGSHRRTGSQLEATARRTTLKHSSIKKQQFPFGNI